MEIIRTVSEMQSTAEQLRAQGKRVALVPTMGALHAGHLSLVDIALKKADAVVVSIFVNPTQFGPNEDFDSYPRTLEADLEKLKEKGVQYVFTPERDDFYPKDFSTYISEEKLSKGLCGASRPGHFRGVCTVVGILFNIVHPHLAVFGQKDAQQVAVVRRMVRDLRMGVEIVVAPIVREESGLAMSSRNRYMVPEQRNDALRISQALKIAKQFIDNGTRSADRVIAEITNHLYQSRRIRVIYAHVVDRETLVPLREIIPGKSMIVLAVWVGEVRLIDNLEI